jgi:O-antigen/teichoic acid export membrane protein
VRPVAKILALLRAGKFDRIAVMFDQGFTSLGNFALTLTLVRAHSTQEFGAFGMGVITLVMLSSLYRYAFVVPVSLWPTRRFLRRIRALSTHHLIVQLLLGGLLLATDGLLSLAGAPVFVTNVVRACFGMSFIYMSIDFDRAAMVRIKGALFACAVSVTLSTALMAVSAAIYLHALSFATVMYLTAGLGLAKTLFVNFRPGAMAPRHARYLSGHLLKTALWGGTGNLLSAVYNTAPQWFLGVHSPPLQVAGFAAVRTLLQPLMVAMRSFDVVDKTAFARIDPADRSRRARRVRNSVLLYLGLSSAVALLVSLNAATLIGFVLGPRYLPFESTLILTSLYYIVTATVAPLETVTFAHGRQRQYALAQGAGAILCALATYPLVLALQADGAVLAAFVGWIPPLVLLLIDFRDEMRAGAEHRKAGG